MVKKIYSKNYSDPIRFNISPVVLHKIKMLVKSRLVIPLLAGLLFAAVVAGFTLFKSEKKLTPADVYKSLVFQRQLIGRNQYVGDIKGVMKTSLATEKDGGRVTVSRGKSNLEFTIPIDNPTLNSQSVGILQATDVSFASQDKIIAARYNLVPNGIKEEIILNKIPQENTLPIKIKLDNLQIKLNPDDIPVFYDPGNQYQFHFERPYVTDGAGDVSYGVKYKFIDKNNKSPDLFTEIKGSNVKRQLFTNNKPLPDSEYVLVIEIDTGWLHDPKRVLPIVIDPTVVHDTTSEFASGNYDRNADVGTGFITGATGGTVSYADGYTIHTFTSSDTFTPSDSGNVEVLAVGGGGGGGETIGGGGGGGGVLYNSSFAVTTSPISVTIGPGGNGAPGACAYATGGGTSGSNSVFSTLTALGGGGGGNYNNTTNGASAGGSGGGIGAGNGATAMAGTQSQGNNGGISSTNTNNGAGGGGSGAVGTNGVSGTGAAGGAGSSFNISGFQQYFGGGGGGGARNPNGVAGGAGGTGGGGGGGYDGGAGTSGTANTGGGGGGGGYRNTGPICGAGGSGGSGIVIVRYPTNPKITTDYQELAADENTAGLWHMNEASGTTTVSDSTGNSITGTSSSSTNVAAGLLENARTFNGTTDEINLGTALQPSFPITMEAWVYVNSLSTELGVVNTDYRTVGSGFHSGAWMNITTSGTILLAFGSNVNCTSTGRNTLTSTNTVSVGKWYHVAGVLRGASDMSIYINGQDAGGAYTGTATTMVYGGKGAAIGLQNGCGGGSNRYFNGTIDEARISRVARTPEDIRLAASRRPYSIYTSDVIDATMVSSWNSFTWTELGVTTGDGETLKDSANLIARWNLNTTSGTTTPNFGGSCSTACTGSLQNFSATGSQDAAATTGWTSLNRRWGTGALMFDGTDDWVWTSNDASLQITGSLSIEAWIKTSVANGDRGIFGKMAASPNYGYVLRLNSGVAEMGVSSTGSNFVSTLGTKRVDDGQWHYVVGVYNPSGSIDLYVDGALQISNSTSIPASIFNTTAAGAIGSTYNGSSFFNGIIDSVRVYSRSLTATEILSNYNSSHLELQTRVGDSTNPDDGTWEIWAPTTGETQIDSFDSTLGNGLVSYWNLDEASGTRYDRWGTSNLTANGTGGVGTGTGKINGSADFESTESDFLEIADNAALSTGDIDFTISAWVNLESEAVDMDIVSKYEGGGVQEYRLFYLQSSDVFRFTIQDAAGATVGAVNSSINPSTGTWYHITVYHDSVNNQVGMIINNGTPTTGNTSASPTDTASSFRLGARNTTETSFFDGLIDEVGFWKRTLSSDEVTYLYSSGSPKNNLFGTDLTNLAQHGGIKPTAETVVVQENSASTKYTTGRPEIDGSTLGLWHLDETGGTGAYIKDSTSNAYDGTPTGGITTVNGLSDKAKNFSSTNYISLGNISMVDNLANVTVEAWVRPTDLTASTHSRTFTENAVLYVGHYGAQVSFYMGNGTSWLIADTTGGALPINTWSHVVWVKNGTSYYIYINGKLSKVGSGAPATLGTSANTNAFGEGSTQPWIGALDEIRISNVARSDEEIAESYRSGRDHYINKTISSTDLSSKNSLPYYVAADRPGTYLESIIGESAFANYQPDVNTVGQWHLDETTPDNVETPGTSGLVGWWKMNEASGNVADSSGNGFTGTVTGTTVVAGRSGYGRSLNGTASDYITVTENDALDPTAITISAWINPVAATGNFVNKGDNLGYRFRTLSGSTTVQFLDRGGTNTLTSTANSITPGIWQHVSVTGDSSGLKIYINGVLNNSNAVAYGGPNTAVNLIMGYYNAPGTEAYNGSMDNVQIYNRALTASEILQQATFTKPKDVSGNGNDGSLWGTTSTQGKIGKARSFNGTSDYVSISDSNSLDLSTNFTISLWFKADVLTQTNRYLLSKLNDAASDNAYSVIWEYVDNTIEFYSNDFTGTAPRTGSGIKIDDTLWHHIAYTYNGTNWSGYKDGVPVFSTARTFSLNATTGSLHLGAFRPNSTFGWTDGNLDEVRIDNTARTSDEIRQAYESGLRSHPITIDFAASLDSDNLIASSGDMSFTVDATYYGLSSKGSKIYSGDKIIVRENYDGTEYVAQGTVSSVNESTGAVTVASWDTGSTFPSGGYSVNTSVFKWQREYWNITEPLDSEINAVTNITLRVTDGNEGRSIWIDDLESAGDYLTNPSGSTITSSIDKRYFQYRVIEHSSDENVSASLTSVTLDYEINSAPNTPTLDSPTDTQTNISLTPVMQTTATDTDSDNVQYKIDLCEDLAMTTNCQTFDQNSSQTGWSGQNADGNTTYTSGTQGTYTVSTPLDAATTYYWRSYAIDPSGINEWGSTQGTPYSFTTSNPPSGPSTPYAEGATNPTSVIDITPEFSAVQNDPDGDSANYYQIEVNTQADFLGTSMWDSTKQSMTTTANGVRSPDISYSGTAIPLDGAGTTYYWRIKFWDTNGAEGSYTTAQSFTMNVKPGTPTLDSPTDTAVNQSLLVTLKTTATDTDSDYLKYKIQMCTDSGMTLNCQTFDQTLSQTGWSGQNAETSTAYTSGTQASYLVQSPLNPSTTYYWRSYGIDPGGSNTWSPTQGAPYSFTTTSTDYPTQCRVVLGPNGSYLTVKWNDNSTTEINYEVQKSTDGGAFSTLQTLAADSTSHQDNSVIKSHSYQYKVAAIFSGPVYSEWCTTSTVTLPLDTNKFGIN
jgi:hypothetical protein